MKPLPCQTSDEILLGDGATAFAFAAGSGALLGVRGEGAEGVALLAGENWRLVLAGTAAGTPDRRRDRGTGRGLAANVHGATS